MLLFFLAVLALPTVGYFLIRQEKVQDYLIHRISSKLTDFFGAPISLSAATIDLFSNITLRDFCVRSPQNDTILYTPELKLQLNSLTLSSKYMEFEKIKMINPDINFYIDSTRNINFLFLLKKLGMTDTTSSPHPMVIVIHEINLKSADFSLKAFNKMQRDSSINFTDLHIKPLNIRITNFRSDHGVSMNVKECSAIEKSGFVLEKFASQLKINKKNMVFNHLSLQTPLSNIQARQVLFNFNSFKDFKTGIFGKVVKLNIELESSDISSDDIAWFAPALKHYNMKARISGTVHGRINDLKIRDLDVSYGDHTHFKGNLDISGLPNLSSSFLHVDIKSLYTTPGDIENLKLPKHKNGRILLPDQFKEFTFLTYRGKFTGFINDFVAYGKITTNLGNIESDLSLQPDTSNCLSFKGQIKADQFNFGQFINKTNLFGNISLNIMANGRLGGTKNIEAKCNGTVNSFVFNNYNYQNVKINGTLSNNTYDGSVSISDPNINCDFLGKVNLSNHIPVFNFKANVTSANLYKLNIDKKDTSSFVSFYITADFEGNNIDNLNGEIKLWNSTLRRYGKEIQISDFLLFTKNVNDTNRIILQSNLADAEVWGTYQFKELANSFKALAWDYLPALAKNQPTIKASSNNFKFEVNFKNTQQLTDFFIPGLYLSKDSKLRGNYNPSKNDLNFLMTIPLLQHKSKKWYNVYFNGKTTKHNLLLTSGCNTLRINNKTSLDNFTIVSDFKHDSIDLHIRWNNFDTISNKGDISILASLKTAPNHSKPIVNLVVEPSQLVLNDSLWQLQSGPVEIDSSEIKIEQFYISHLNQSIKIYGSISQKVDNPLSFELSHINLSNLDSLTASKKIEIGGIINGKADLLNLYHNPIIRASLSLDSLSINKVSLGKTMISAVYDNSDKNITIDAFSERGFIKTLNIKGTYATLTKSFDFHIDLNKLKLDIFRPYLASIFSDVRGIATGSLELTGTPQAPLLNGSVTAQKASFMINYLKTRYNFTHTIDIKKNTFLLNNIEVFDSLVNKAIVKGEIEYRNFKELHVDITIDAKKFLCLHTAEKDNTMFYGQAFATGKVSINGVQKNITIDIINATTDAPVNQKTTISIPLGTKTELAESNYIRFINKQQPSLSLNQYEIDKTNDNKKIDIPSSTLKMNFNLQVTPDAEVQIVFDPKIGDIIEGNGAAKNLRMTVENGIFNMYGTYTIAKGHYLFTCKNIFERKFDIEQGGTITWNGNPLDATVNIQANYGLNTSLYPLGLGAGEEFKKPIGVECRLFLTDKLMTPNIRYDIYLPNADQETRNLVNNVINTDEELSNQVLALLFAGYFISPSNSAASGLNGYSAAGANGLEFLSNQLSRMLSQISKDFDIGVNYRPGQTNITTDQVEVAMSTQLLNDKVLINGNMDVGGKQATSNTSNIVGEGNVELKLTNNGKLRLKAFNRSNENYDAEQSQYTQGVGVSYKDNFNSFKELFKRYYHMLFTRKEEKNEPVDETKNDSNKDTETGNE